MFSASLEFLEENKNEIDGWGHLFGREFVSELKKPLAKLK